MASVNHQFIQFEDKVVKRYTKTIPGLLTGRRLDPHRPENTIEFLLHTPESNFNFGRDEQNKTTLTRHTFSYLDEVIELYSEQEVKLFERLNRKTIESGVLVVYNEEAPAVDMSNVLSEEEVISLAQTKQLLALKKRLMQLTSVYSLQRVLDRATELDRPISIVKAIQERINELSANNTR